MYELQEHAKPQITFLSLNWRTEGTKTKSMQTCYASYATVSCHANI